MLREFIAREREQILARARSRVASRSAPQPTEAELSDGLPMFLDQLAEALRKASSSEKLDHTEIQDSARDYGIDRFAQGLTIAQVVHDYGDLCQIITGLAIERREAIPVEEFQTFNLCLDDAIAGAVTSHAKKREGAISDEGTERLGFLAHELRNELNVAMLSSTSIALGVVGLGGSTSALHHDSLMRLSTLIDRSMAEVRLDAGVLKLERLPVWEILEEVEVGAAMRARTRGINLKVLSISNTVTVAADRQILCAAIANLLQNAIKFTHPHTTVTLRASTTATRVLIDVEDECGGLPLEKQKNLLKPFTQNGNDRSGLGLGLAICMKAMKTLAGELHIRDVPGKGCVFTIDLPKQPPTPSS